LSGGFASAHGWWFNVDCPAGTKAHTHIDLVEKLFGQWIDVGAGDATSYSGSGSGKWATAKSSCVNATSSQYYSLIRTDLIGRTEIPRVAQTDTMTLACW
jgi:hypothetical protein